MISDLYDGIVHVFRQYRCPAVVYLGEQYRAQHTGGLRVVLWQGSQSPADQFLPKNESLATWPTQQLQLKAAQFINPRPVATRRCGFSAELWATAPKQRVAADQWRANMAYLDALVNQFAVALQHLASGVFMVQSGLAAQGNADADVMGLGYTLQVSTDVPVIDVPWPAQQLGKCSETWAYGPAVADVSVVDTQTEETHPPVFRVPTPEE